MINEVIKKVRLGSIGQIGLIIRNKKLVESIEKAAESFGLYIKAFNILTQISFMLE